MTVWLGLGLTALAVLCGIALAIYVTLPRGEPMTFYDPPPSPPPPPVRPPSPAAATLLRGEREIALYEAGFRAGFDRAARIYAPKSAWKLPR